VTGGVYRQWSAWLADFGEGREDVPLDSLPALLIEDLGARAAARTCQRCVAALNQRVELWSQQFRRDLERARSVPELRRALGSARTRLDSLRALAESRLLFDDLRASLREQLQSVLDEAQKDLERHARGTGAERDILLRVIREQPVNRAVRVDLAEEAPGSPCRSTPVKPPSDRALPKWPLASTPREPPVESSPTRRVLID
jgi:DNA-binding transcriptional ArsR family regulator